MWEDQKVGEGGWCFCLNIKMDEFVFSDLSGRWTKRGGLKPHLALGLGGEMLQWVYYVLGNTMEQSCSGKVEDKQFFFFCQKKK